MLSNFVYRRSHPLQIHKLLNDGFILPHTNRYVSFSETPDIETILTLGNDAGSVQMVVSWDELQKQHPVRIDYDKMGDYDKYPNIGSYITGFANIDDFEDNYGYVQQGYSKDEVQHVLWPLEVSRYRDEQEIILPKLTHSKMLIARLCFDDGEDLVLTNEELLRSQGFQPCTSDQQQQCWVVDPDHLDPICYPKKGKKSHDF